MIDIIRRNHERVDDIGDGIIHPGNQLVPTADKKCCIGSLAKLAICCRLDDFVRFSQNLRHHLDHRIEVVFDDVVLAFVIVGDLGRNNTLADFVHIVCGDHQRIDDVGDDVINPDYQLFPSAYKQLGVGTFIQFSISRCDDDLTGFIQQVVHNVNAVVQVVLDFIEIAVVVVRNSGRNIALADPIHIFSSDVQRTDDGIEGFIDAGNDGLEIALMFAGIGASGQLAVYCGLCKRSGI